MVEDLRVYGPSILAWAAAAYKLPAFCRQRRDPTVRAFWLSILLMALALTALVPTVYLAIGHLSGVPNLARLLSNTLALGCCWTVQVFLFNVVYPAERARLGTSRSGWTLVATLAVMTILFTRIPAGEAATD